MMRKLMGKVRQTVSLLMAMLLLFGSIPLGPALALEQNQASFEELSDIDEVASDVVDVKLPDLEDDVAVASDDQDDTLLAEETDVNSDELDQQEMLAHHDHVADENEVYAYEEIQANNGGEHVIYVSTEAQLRTAMQFSPPPVGVTRIVALQNDITLTVTSGPMIIPAGRDIVLTSAGDTRHVLTQAVAERRHFDFPMSHGAMSTLTLENIELNGGGVAGGIYLVNTRLVMENGSLITNTFTRSGAVSVTLLPVGVTPEFVMNGGEISNNTTTSASGTHFGGGGVHIGSGTFTMNGGEISNNTATHTGGGMHLGGGGVHIGSGTFTMNGGEISNNTTTNHGGGVHIRSGTFTMNGGEISNNTATSGGGGVHNHGGGVHIGSGTFTMGAGARIVGNRAGSGGGISLRNTTLEMNGGEISNNSAEGGNHVFTSNGGGVHMDSGTFTMDAGARIVGNRATNGGGISLRNTTLEMNDGVIRDNTATALGGGIFVSLTSMLYVADAFIAENHAGLDGGGIFTENSLAPNAYQNLNLTNIRFEGNRASVSFDPPVDADALTNIGFVSTSTRDHPLNNYDINFRDVWVSVSTEGELRNAIASAPIDAMTTVVLQNDIEMNNAISIPAGRHIVLTSVSHTRHVLLRRLNTGRHFIVGRPTVSPLATLTLENIELNGAGFAGGIDVPARGGLVMEEGSLITNSFATNGGGVHIGSGTFTMNGGEISNNRSTQNGSGVHMDSGTFAMNSGEISNNTAMGNTGTGNNGGGVHLAGSGGTFTMGAGARIVGNRATNGGGVSFSGLGMHDFIMNGGEISNNEAMRHGGGVYANVAMDMMIEDGSIIENNATNGGGIWLENTILEMNGGVIRGNTATALGGGIFVPLMTTSILLGSVLNVTDTFITENHAGLDGGGIFTEDFQYGLDPLAPDAYQSLNLTNIRFEGNRASGSFDPPVNADALANIDFVSTSTKDHPLNNYDINFRSGFIVSFDAGEGGVVSANNQERFEVAVTSGNLQSIDPNHALSTALDAVPTASRDGYHFLGWSYTQNPTITDLDYAIDVDDAGLLAMIPSDEVTLYAVYEKLEVTEPELPEETSAFSRAITNMRLEGGNLHLN